MLFRTSRNASNDLSRGTFAAILSHNQAASQLLPCDIVFGQMLEKSGTILFAEE
jgi:hypothetical protein